jgi:hypothetical protein
MVGASQATLIVPQRATVSRTRGDLRTIGIALEEYRLDHGFYPRSSGSPEWRIQAGALTTPVAHLSDSYADPFKDHVFIRDPHPQLRVAIRALLIWLTLFATTALFLWLSPLIPLPSRRILDPRERRVRFLVICGTVSTVLFLGIARLGSIFYVVGVIPVPNPTWEGRDQEYAYWTDGSTGWVLQGVGPDGVRTTEDLTAISFESALATSLDVIPLCYDPTNGGGSTGDIFRFGPDPNSYPDQSNRWN